MTVPAPINTPTADCYSSAERRWMNAGQRLRAWLLAPALKALERRGIHADHITALSLGAGLAFCPLFFVSKTLAFAMLALHVLLDGLDGPLARLRNNASRKGSFTDSMADQIVIAASTTTLMAAGTVAILPGTLYILAYTLVVLFAMIRNAFGIPYRWLLRPRFIIYAWLIAETYYFPGTINIAVWAFALLLSAFAVRGFFRIRAKL